MTDDDLRAYAARLFGRHTEAKQEPEQEPEPATDDDTTELRAYARALFAPNNNTRSTE